MPVPIGALLACSLQQLPQLQSLYICSKASINAPFSLLSCCPEPSILPVRILRLDDDPQHQPTNDGLALPQLVDLHITGFSNDFGLLKTIVSAAPMLRRLRLDPGKIVAGSTASRLAPVESLLLALSPVLSQLESFETVVMFNRPLDELLTQMPKLKALSVIPGHLHNPSCLHDLGQPLSYFRYSWRTRAPDPLDLFAIFELITHGNLDIICLPSQCVGRTATDWRDATTQLCEQHGVRCIYESSHSKYNAQIIRALLNI